MPIIKLDTRTVPALKLAADTDDAVYWDAELSNFGYRLRRRGAHVRKSWIIQYQNRNRVRRRFTFAPGELPVGAARKQAAELLAKVRIGQDPQGEKVAARVRGTLIFRTVVDDFIADHTRLPSPDGWRPRTVKQYRHILFTCCKPLHDMPIDEIKRVHISPLLATIERERGRRTAVISRVRLLALFGWAMREGRIEVNPVIGTREIKHNPNRERVLNNDELAKLWRAASDPSLFPRGGRFGHVVRLLILTGGRRSEIGGMRWCELDDKGNWTLPSERSKNHRAHTLPLPPIALAIIKDCLCARLNGTDSENVFGIGYMNRQALLTIRARVGFHDWWVHDIRRTVATGMNEIGIQPHIVECILNHVGGFRAGVAGIYNRATYEREMAQALERWADHVVALAEGRADKVIPLRSA